MNTDFNNEEYPRLTPPEVVYEHKDALKKNAVVIPLYVKLVAAAAAVALLFGIFWFRSSLPEQELLAELKPIRPQQVQSVETTALAESQAHFIVTKKTIKSSSVQPEKVDQRDELPLLAELRPITASILIPTEPPTDQQLAYSAQSTYSIHPTLSPDSFDDRSLISRGIAKMTDGECESFADILVEGFRSVKGEMSSLAMTIQSSRSQLRQRVR